MSTAGAAQQGLEADTGQLAVPKFDSLLASISWGLAKPVSGWLAQLKPDPLGGATRMRDGYAIRSATISDLPRLPEVERSAAALFAPFGLAELFARVLTPPSDLEEALRTRRLWVATVAEDEVAGFALASIVGSNAHLDELDVVPGHGRRGIGSALVEVFLRWARDSGLPGATLTTLAHIPWNAPFYQRLGFRVVQPREMSPALSELLRQEIQRGLPAENRVAMHRPLP